MTLSHRPSTLDIMTLREVRDANESGAGVAVLDRSLEKVLWANAAGRALLGLASVPADAEPVPLPPGLPATRQIKVAARLLGERGAARLLLRSGAGIGAKPVVADLRRIAGTGADRVFFAVESVRPSPVDETVLARQLLEDSLCLDASVHGRSGRLVASRHETLPVPEPDPVAIAAFLDTDAPFHEIEADGRRTTFARIASGLVLVRREAIEAREAADETPADGTPAMPEAGDGEAAAPAESRTGGFFSVRRRRLPTGRAPMNMNALVERWHSRQAPAAADFPIGPAAPDAAAEDLGEPQSASSFQASADIAPPAEAAVSPGAAGFQADERPASDVADDGPSTASGVETDKFEAASRETSPSDALTESAERAQPLRSIWGVLPMGATPRDAIADGAVDAPPSGLGQTDAPADEATGADTAEPTVAANVPAPAAETPKPSPVEGDGSAPSAMPNEDGWVADGETDQPAERDAAVVFPDLPQDEAERLDQPLSTDIEVPAEEALVPGADDGALPDGMETSDPTTASGAQDAEAQVETIVPDGTRLDRAERPADADTALPGAGPADADVEDVAARQAIEASLEPPADRSALAPAAPSTEKEPGATTPDDRASETDGNAPAFGRRPDGDDAADEAGFLNDTMQQPTPAGSLDLPAGEESVDGAPAEEAGKNGVAEDAARPFAPRFDMAPVRFVWQIDRHGNFSALSPAFAAAVGPKAADVIGRGFRDVSQVFGFDADGEISRLLDRRDTWSGRSIFWPVENSDRKVPMDLAALPVYAADRSFDGFRGFGVLRMGEWIIDPEAIGDVLGKEGPAASTATGEEIAPVSDPSTAPLEIEPPERPLLRTFAGDFPAPIFGRRPEPPQNAAHAPADDDAHDTQATDDGPLPKVIRLEERRRPKDGVLSQAEEAAFRAIGMKLGTPSEAESPGALRFAEAPPLDDASVDMGNQVAARRADDGDAATLEPIAPIAVDPVADDVAAGHSPASRHDASDPATVPERRTRMVDGDGRQPGEGEGDHDVSAAPPLAEIDSIFGSLPLPVLVQIQESLVYANREFGDLTGYEGISALVAAGGLDALFVEPQDGSGPGEIAIRRSSGQVLEVRVHMQRVTLSGRSCLLMSFSPSPREIAAATAAPLSAPVMETSPAPVLSNPADEQPFADDDEDLRQQIEELQAVLDTATDGIVLLDPAGNIRAMNGSAQALFGTGQNDHQGRHLSTLFAHESQKATHDYLEMLRDDGMAGILNDGREVIGRVAQGGFIPLFITVGRLSGERGWCVVIRDIAHWKRIEEDLVNARRQAEAASLHKSRFLANISHELRTPLNAIIGFADVMASECFGPIGNERYLEYLSDIKRSGHHVLDLVNDLLDISKIEAGKLDLAFEAVPLNEVVSEVVSLMQPQANRERVIVRSNLPSSVPPVVADRRTIRQIALNLVANAIRFTPAGGQIIVSTTYTAEGDVVLRFRDSGIGMTEREIEIALTPFQQVHSPSVNRGEGTGLGLPLTKAMVEANRALFAIHSTPGEGTLVEISFPSQRVLAD